MDAAGLDRVLKNLDLLILSEEAVADFYQACAETWPQEGTFWSDLAADELLATARLELMRERAKNSENAARSIRIFPLAALTTFLAWVGSSRARVLSGEVGHRGALAIARDLERSPIVNEHYQVARGTERELANYLLSFATDYDKHTRRIEERLGQSVMRAKVA